MENAPYKICIFTIRHTDTLDNFYRNGAKGEINEKQRWVEAKVLQVKAQLANQPFLVVFCASEYVDELLYYAVLDEIRVHPTKYETDFKFSNMKRFEAPAPHKTELVIVSKKETISNGQIRPYSICQTPPILYGVKPQKESKPKLPTIVATTLTVKEVRSATLEVIFHAAGKRMFGDDQIFRDDEFEPHGSSVAQGRRNRISKAISEGFQQRHNFKVEAKEVAKLEKVDELVALIRRKLESG